MDLAHEPDVPRPAWRARQFGTSVDVTERISAAAEYATVTACRPPSVRQIIVAASVVELPSSTLNMGKAKRVSLFKVLRRELGPNIAAGGVSEVPQDASCRNYILLYFRDQSHRGQSPASEFGFWFQRDVKSLYVDALGSSFTAEFFRSLDDPFKAGGGRQRVYFLLSPTDLEEMRAIQNGVIKRLPPLEGFLAPWEMESFGEFAEKQRQLIEKPFNPRHEVWMRYRDEADILTWTAFIGRLLPTLVERFQRLTV